ncbi:uncharacterized protein LOC117142816 isoform X1 [Drosophila mauritiana]|uniref:Uncharacterized protein LOC117142816 isoform X1 n=1 Tax=Drosophila mauritiana TaxID=7226 RepID=A0A6P8K2J1_DROMA|nr:uncharacterized protein LOC117142816 isoform X1 [Drosophila mauritiana]
MKLLWLLLVGVVAGQPCDKLCPITDNFGCVSKDNKCFYTVRNTCILKAINCYRKSKSLSALKPILRSKCTNKEVPVCDNINK